MCMYTEMLFRSISKRGLGFAVSIPNHVVVATASWGCLGLRGEAYTPV